MNVNIEIIDGSDWATKLHNKVLKITALDMKSSFELGILFANIHTHEHSCSCIREDFSITIPLVQRDNINLPLIKGNI